MILRSASLATSPRDRQLESLAIRGAYFMRWSSYSLKVRESLDPDFVVESLLSSARCSVTCRRGSSRDAGIEVVAVNGPLVIVRVNSNEGTESKRTLPSGSTSEGK
jgi:hypothetical protein